MKNFAEPTPAGPAFIKYAHPFLPRSSYLVADTSSRTAAVIDPFGDVDRYLEDAWRLGTSIRHIFLTHLRDEDPTGVRELQERTCSTIYLGAWARPDFEFMPLKDGDVLEFGNVRLQILEIPGHRLEGIAVVVYDLEESSQNPYAVLTGDTVRIGDVGRPEPRPSDGYGARSLAGMLYDSLHLKILNLPDSTRICPSLEAETWCEPEGPGNATVGSQRHHNPAFRPMSREDFVDAILSGARPEPGQNGFPGVPMRPAGISEILRGVRAGAQLIDVRDPDAFAGAHLEGSLNLPLRAEWGEWVKAVVDRDRPILIVAPPG